MTTEALLQPVQQFTVQQLPKFKQCIPSNLACSSTGILVMLRAKQCVSNQFTLQASHHYKALYIILMFEVTVKVSELPMHCIYNVKSSPIHYSRLDRPVVTSLQQLWQLQNHCTAARVATDGNS